MLGVSTADSSLLISNRPCPSCGAAAWNLAADDVLHWDVFPLHAICGRHIPRLSQPLAYSAPSYFFELGGSIFQRLRKSAMNASRFRVISRMTAGGAAVFSCRAAHRIISISMGARSIPFSVSR